MEQLEVEVIGLVVVVVEVEVRGFLALDPSPVPWRRPQRPQQRLLRFGGVAQRPTMSARVTM